MKKYDLWSGIVWLVLGIAFCITAGQTNLGSFRHPGIGFFSFFVGALLALFSAVLIITALRTSVEKEKDDQLHTEDDRLSWKSLRTPVMIIVILLGYVLLLELFGFLVTTFVCLLTLFKLTEPGKWRLPLIMSGSAILLSYIVFIVWLKNPFPKGILGF